MMFIVYLESRLPLRLSEARGLVVGKLFDDVSAEVQSKLKATLLQEVASVAIDL